MISMCATFRGSVYPQVLYEKWSHAEAAVETEQGKSSLGGTNPLVVKFADPPKRASTASTGPSVGIAPKKLFVGQVRQHGSCNCMLSISYTLMASRYDHASCIGNSTSWVRCISLRPGLVISAASAMYII
jgi:hypothetical protein